MRRLNTGLAIFALGAAALCAPLAATPAVAQDYPTHPVKFIVPFPPGGTLDVLARMVADKLRGPLGQQVLVENKPGAAGAIGAQAVATAEPDGHTIFIASNTLVTLPALRKELPFDPMKSFAPIIELAFTPTIITLHPSLPARDYPQFVAMVKGMKDGLSYSSPGIASPPHLAGELLARAANIPMVHIPQKGTAPAVTDLLSGAVPAMMAPLNAVLDHIKQGRLFAIASIDASRATDLPNIPTLHESGLSPAVMPAVSSWFGILTTAGTPPAVVQRLNTEINKILAQPDVIEKLRAQTFEARGGTVQSFAKLMAEEGARNAKIVADANIKAE
jgi:tripartite-type tricarboxylate transporter receptor subunit TctC